MKKSILLILLGALLFAGPVFGADISAPIYTVNLTISGSTTALNQSGTYSGISIFTVDGRASVIDLASYKPINRVFSVTAKKLGLALSNLNKVTLTSVNASGTTYTLYYIPSNVDSANIWPGAGVTTFGGTRALSGSTPYVQTFTPEFARFYKIGFLSGMTQFKDVEFVLSIQ